MHKNNHTEKSATPFQSMGEIAILKNEFLFLHANEIECLAGKKHKKTQIEALRRMGIHFFVNGIGAPVVPRPQFFGKKTEVQTTWKPRVLEGNK